MMGRVLELALKGRTSPNPKVGCIITKDSKVISEGYHEQSGGPHAEIAALKKAGSQARNAIMWINLEPCCHHGKTPPCINAIKKAGIKEVIIAMKDPNPIVSGKGIKALKKAGIKVNLGFMEKEAKRVNEWYCKYITTKMPFVLMKVAMSLDGKITSPDKYITCKESIKFVHVLRNSVDAIMVGVNTVINDNPHLTCRLKAGHDPIRIILDSKLRIPLNVKVLKDKNVIIATTSSCNQKKRKELEDKKIDVVEVNEGERVDVKKLLGLLAEKGLISILVEGGNKLNTEILENNLADKLLFFVAPKILGNELHFSNNKNKIELKNVKINNIGKDVMVEAYLN